MTLPLEGKDSKIVISEMVIAGNIVTRRGISVARAIWFVCCKLLKIFFSLIPDLSKNTCKASAHQ